MDDLISRQAAIDAMFNLCDRLSEPCYHCENPHIDVIVDELEQLPSATDTNVGTKLGTNLAEVGTDAISRQAAIDALNEYFARIGKLKRRGLTKGEKAISLDTVGAIKTLPPAEQNLSEEYAKAVRNWLVNYQIKCAELKGRYTPYEVLGWIVSDWRKENGIW